MPDPRSITPLVEEEEAEQWEFTQTKNYLFSEGDVICFLVEIKF